MSESESKPNVQKLTDRLVSYACRLRDELTTLSLALKDLQFELQYQKQVCTPPEVKELLRAVKELKIAPPRENT